MSFRTPLGFNDDIKVGVHQPNYFPWIGYFHKINLCDHFVFLDQVEISKRSPTRRVKIKGSSGGKNSTWLTVPLIKHSDRTYITDLKIDFSQNWIEQHLGSIASAYSMSPYFNDYYSLIQSWLRQAIRFEYLSTLNQYLVKEICELIKIDTHFSIAENSELDRSSKTMLNKSLVKARRGNVYISGQGGAQYLDIERFDEDGIKICFYDIDQFKKPEISCDLSHSILEPLFELGEEGIVKLLYENLRFNN